MDIQGCQVSPYIVKQLLNIEGLGSRSMLKANNLKVVENRNEQFEKYKFYGNISQITHSRF